jgi:hypothetical protein
LNSGARQSQTRHAPAGDPIHPSRCAQEMRMLPQVLRRVPEHVTPRSSPSRSPPSPESDRNCRPISTNPPARCDTPRSPDLVVRLLRDSENFGEGSRAFRGSNSNDLAGTLSGRRANRSPGDRRIAADYIGDLFLLILPFSRSLHLPVASTLNSRFTLVDGAEPPVRRTRCRTTAASRARAPDPGSCGFPAEKLEGWDGELAFARGESLQRAPAYCFSSIRRMCPSDFPTFSTVWTMASLQAKVPFFL